MSYNSGIDENISSTKQLSEVASGYDIAPSDKKGQNATVAVQVVPVNSNDFEVSLEAALPSKIGMTFTEIGSYDQDSETFMSTIQVTLGASYRFRHVSGVGCQVILGG